MQNVLPPHHKQVLTTLQALDPVQARLSQESAAQRRWLAPFERLIAALRYWHRRRATIQALKNLPDWALQDIGVLRAEIPTVVDAVLSSDAKAAADASANADRGKSRLAA